MGPQVRKVLVGVRPTVMISSTIGELAAERQAIAEALEEGGLADGWLFELHATAAGESPEARYLAVARSCDLYVIIVAAQGSAATEAEYHAAYEDNPRKILPFFVGDPTDATRALRDLIESRHIRAYRNERADLVTAVADAITDQIRSGDIVWLPLTDVLNVRLRRAEQVVSTKVPLCFIPRLQRNGMASESDLGTERLPASILLDREQRVVLEGIGGSGKTYAALTMLHHASGNGVLPIVVHPTSNDLSIQELVTGAFEAVRFFPGDALLHQLARSGRLAIMVDGIDGLASDERRIFLADVDEFSRRFPRSAVICCVRRALSEELKSFGRYTLEALSNRQLADMFRSVDASEVTTFPPQVADLARWPLWAWALLEIGAGASTGLVLLQQLLEHRIRGSGAYTPIEAELLTDAAAVMAFKAWPQASMATKEALTTLATWRSESNVRSKFAVPPAETLVQRLSDAGIVQLTPEVVFAHPLFATYLGAHHAATSEPMTDAMASDPEFAMFVTALLGEDQADAKLTHLLRHGPVGQARYLRLVPETSRNRKPNDPIAFGTAAKALSGSAAECIVSDDWTAWRTANESANLGVDAVDLWLADGDVTFLPGDAFKRRSPLDVATIESLARFKDSVLRQRPEEDRHDRLTDAELKRLRDLPREDLDELILQVVIDWRGEWRQQAVAMGLSTLPEASIGDDGPLVTVYEEWPDPRVRIEWVGPACVTWVQPDSNDSMWFHRTLSWFLDPGRSARIYHELVERAERALGCRFTSQAWSRPEHVAAWAW